MEQKPTLYRSLAANGRLTPNYALGWKLTKEQVRKRVVSHYAEIPYAIAEIWHEKGYADSLG